MVSFLTAFFIAALLTMLLIRHAKQHGFALDNDFQGVQKFHANAVPRIGGLGIFISVSVTAVIAAIREPITAKALGLLLVCSSFAFFGGIIEDLTKNVSPARRLLLTMLAAGLGYFLMGARLSHIDWYFFDLSFPYPWVSLPVTILLVAGIANAVNLIDGFNGLASVVTICMLLSLGYVAFQVGDMFVLISALTVAGATAGFLIWNFPAGLIFLGDGGAYFIGFMLGELAVLLVMRNAEVSSWYAGLLLIYPAFETLFSVYRRVFLRGRPAGMPDGIHLHSLIFRRIVQWTVGPEDARSLTRRNSFTSPYLWLLSMMAVLPATMFWRHTVVLMVFCLVFVFSYIWLYTRIVRFKSPRWLMVRKRKR